MAQLGDGGQMQTLCQSCEREVQTVVEPCDSAASPYLICKACHGRLHARSLRPREWYNLSKRFGWWQFLLHDDFYDEDGTASQPEEEITSPDAFPIPALEEVERDAHLLLDFTITRWQVTDALAARWHQLPSSQVLETLTERFRTTTNVGIRSVVLEVVSIALKEKAADLVESAWRLSLEQIALHSLIRASAECLPFVDAFERATTAIEALPQTDRRCAMSALHYFRSPLTLDWIEKHAGEPITEAWGYLAAASGFSWSRAKSWLEHGRPLSLIAIDALLAIAKPQTPNLRSLQPLLHEAPSAAHLGVELQRYAERDNVPRVRQRIDSLLKHSARISSAA